MQIRLLILILTYTGGQTGRLQINIDQNTTFTSHRTEILWKNEEMLLVIRNFIFSSMFSMAIPQGCRSGHCVVKGCPMC